MTQIEWVLNPDNKTRGITVNSKTGCLNNCPYCYAKKLANGRLKRFMMDNLLDHPLVGDLMSGLCDPFYPRWWPERLEKIRHIRKPTGIFLDDMSDWMGDYWPKEWTEQELQVMRDCPQHRFYTLTKQPQNLQKWEFPENCWVGVTVCNDKMLDVAVDKLEDTQAKVKFISFEPLLERLTLSLDSAFYYSGISWVIIGSQTRPTIYPNPHWVHEIIVACREAGIPYFLKNNLAGCLTKEPPYYYPLGLPANGKLRQEMPDV